MSGNNSSKDPESHAAVRAFLEALAGGVDSARRMAFLDEEALVVVDDVPFPLNREGYADHLDFHSGNWEAREWVPEGVEAAVFEELVVVSCYFNDRGKPKDSGFRQRPGFATATCVKTAEGWRALHLHTSSLRSQILDASPG